jgi:hypothetical protein
MQVGLGARIEAKQAARSNGLCGVAKAAEKMKKVDREEFLRYVNHTRTYASIIAQACREEGYDINPYTINRHRKGQCSCPKEAK